MNSKRVVIIATLLLVSAVGGYQVKAHAQQEFPQPCSAIVPLDWGDFKGVATGAGMVFEDKSGTIRIISQIPCPVDGGVVRPPFVLAVIRRK